MQATIEDLLARQMLAAQNENRTFIDKLLAKDDVFRMRELHKQNQLGQNDIMEMLQLMAGNESKLLNFDENERYIFGRYFIRIREGFSIDEKLWNLYDELKTFCDDPEVLGVWEENLKLVNNTGKFFVDNFQWLSRSGMSISGIGFEKILKHKFEVAYSNLPEKPSEKRGLLGSFFRGSDKN